ncbi:MAG: 2OG-Fe(II) oxygenase [Myxococcota bacterium]|nr:2OG-Fe(II) oxygenase [Myxococcota bacterium]
MTYTVQTQFMSKNELQGLWDELAHSSFVGTSTLKGSFQATSGFGIYLTLAGLPRLSKMFPSLSDWFLHCGAMEEKHSSLNAFYLNYLEVPPNREVHPHIDATLGTLFDQERVLPEWVSVVYLNELRWVRGGELILATETGRVAIKAKRGSMVCFRGHICHGVRAWSPTRVSFNSPKKRCSMVCEQYSLSQEQLKCVPDFHVKTDMGFSAFLKHYSGSGPDPR